VGQYFEPLQSYTKPAGVHPLDIQKLNPLYVWLICLVSFNMLVAGNGMSKLYGVIAGSSSTQLSDGEIRYQQEKVSIGIGSVIILIIVIKVLDKVYYRERLLPDPLYSWLEGLYTDTEREERKLVHAQQRSAVQSVQMSPTTRGAGGAGGVGGVGVGATEGAEVAAGVGGIGTGTGTVAGRGVGSPSSAASAAQILLEASESGSVTATPPSPPHNRTSSRNTTHALDEPASNTGGGANAGNAGTTGGHTHALDEPASNTGGGANAGNAGTTGGHNRNNNGTGLNAPLISAGMRPHSVSVDSDFGPFDGSHSNRGSILTTGSQVFRPSLWVPAVVEKKDVAMGVRRVRPLTFIKIVTSIIMFVIWGQSIAVEDYMAYIALLIVLPSMAEVVLEVRRFFMVRVSDREVLRRAQQQRIDQLNAGRAV
jgi:hypothetical protein